MSGVEMESQNLSPLGRVSGRSGSQGGAGQKDDGLFGALMSGLAAGTDASATPRGAADAVAEGGAAEGESRADGAGGRRPAFSRDLLASMFAGATLDGADEAVRQPGAGEAQAQNDTEEASLAERLAARHKAGGKGERIARAVVGEVQAETRQRPASGPQAETTEDDGASTRDAGAATGDPVPVVRNAADMMTLPVLPPTPVAAGTAEAETAAQDEAGSSAKGGAEALADTLAGADAGDASPLQVTVLAQETHFAPVRADAPAKPVFTLPNEAALQDDARGTERDDASASEGVEPSALERASTRQASERLEARLSERRGAQAGSAAADAAPADTDAVDSGKSAGTASTGGFTGGLPLANLRQVSSAIGAEIARMAAPVPGQSPDAPRTGGGPLRLLDIQLHPSDLGTVTVRMRMSDAGLEVRLSADNAETARMLRNDHAKLADMLAAEGVEEARVSVVDAADQAGAWTRFEMLPRQTSLTFGAERGEERGETGRGAGEQGARKDDDEREAASGGDRSARDRG
ncbi:MAG: flagellar hook-length control protein FliK [Pseudomonadota bacterium]